MGSDGILGGQAEVRGASGVWRELTTNVNSMAQNLTSHHLRVLRAAALVASRRDGKLVMYRLTPLGRSLVGALLGQTASPENATAGT